MRKLASIILAAIIGMTLYSCKTNEKNMNDAYVKAIAGRDADDIGLDSTIYTKIRREMKHGTMTVNGREVDFSTQWIRVTEGGGGIRENIKQYNVVVGQFKMLFNAKSMRERIIEDGYPAAFVVETAEPYYYVVAASFSDAAEAVKFLENTEKDPSLKLKSPLPFILQPAKYR